MGNKFKVNIESFYLDSAGDKTEGYITGWAASKDYDISLLLSLKNEDGKEIPAVFEYEERNDVINAFLKFNSSKGFKIRFPYDKALSENIYLKISEKNNRIIKKLSLKEAEEKFKKGVFILRIDEVSKNDDLVLVKGFGFHRYLSYSIFLEDEKGNKIDGIIERYERPDVSLSFHLNNIKDKKTGFKIKAELKNIPGSAVYLCIASSDKDNILKEKIEKDKIKKEEKIFLNIEGTKNTPEETYITGWCLNNDKDFSLLFFDDKNDPLDVKLTWRRRFDVEKAFEIENKEGRSLGFRADFKADSLKSNKIKVVLKDENTLLKKTIDLNETEKPHRIKKALKDLFTPKMWVKGIRYLFKFGPKKFFIRLFNRGEALDERYNDWFIKNRVTRSELRKQREVKFPHNIKISIVIPLFNTKKEFLKAIIDSVLSQSYENLELCLADGSTKDSVYKYIKNNYSDERIIYKRLEKNEGIAGNTNAALKMATGDFVLLSDHDDILEPDALFEIVKLYNENPSLDIIYTDEDLTDKTGKRFYSPRFKCDYNPDFLNSINYICHIFCVKKEIMDKVGGFRKEFDGAQDWDMILRCTELTEDKNIGHIPKILYHWRAHESSTAGNQGSKEYAIDAGRRAVLSHLERININAELIYTDVFVMFRPKIIPKTSPKVSIIIPNKDEKETLRTCIESIENKATYKNYEIVVVENNSEEKSTFSYYDELLKTYDNVKVCYYDGDFNYSRINNFGAKNSTGEFLLLLNNDTEVITEDFLECMIGYLERENTGIVGAKLYYPDDTVQHCGAVIGIGGFAGHVLTLSTPDDAGYFGRLKAAQDLSAVTAACLMIKRSVFDEVGGLSEDFKVGLNDMDLCLKVREKGYLVALDPGVNLYHYESKTRGFEESKEKHERFKGEIKRFREKWHDTLLLGDPYYNKNLTLMYGDCRLLEENEHSDIIDEIYSDKIKTIKDCTDFLRNRL